jgi:hypothetical protein
MILLLKNVPKRFSSSGVGFENGHALHWNRDLKFRGNFKIRIRISRFHEILRNRLYLCDDMKKQEKKQRQFSKFGVSGFGTLFGNFSSLYRFY